MGEITANTISDFFINHVHKYGDLITNLKLQKLLYYSQGWYLAIYDEVLFPEKFEAWVHGPVIPDIYQRFKKHRWNPIDEDIKEKDINLPEKVKQHLIEVFEVFGSETAWELERMTHRESPWINARVRLSPTEDGYIKIKETDMKDHFASLMDDEDGEN